MSQPSKSLVLASACALALGLTAIAAPDYAVAQISVSITLAPPALPVYEQPVLIEEGGIWAPGYWDYNQDGYFWVPGTWVQPPEAGLLWTPGYWGWGNGGYAWNEGYWGTTVGFYGGIDYGFGYSGRGYSGGHWQGQHFYYNTAVSHVNVTNIHNTYSQTVVNNTTVNRISYNGGTGGIRAEPSATEQARAAPVGNHGTNAASSGGDDQSCAVSIGQQRQTRDRGHLQAGRIQWRERGQGEGSRIGGASPRKDRRNAGYEARYRSCRRPTRDSPPGSAKDGRRRTRPSEPATTGRLA
jgi:hypothetical protein